MAAWEGVRTAELPPLADEPDGLLRGALPVGADGEPEVLRVDDLFVRGQADPAPGRRHPLDADEHVHARILAFSGSNGGVLPATATVTG